LYACASWLERIRIESYTLNTSEDSGWFMEIVTVLLRLLRLLWQHVSMSRRRRPRRDSTGGESGPEKKNKGGVGCGFVSLLRTIMLGGQGHCHTPSSSCSPREQDEPLTSMHVHTGTRNGNWEDPGGGKVERAKDGPEERRVGVPFLSTSPA
jgi:hypothetical protein